MVALYTRYPIVARRAWPAGCIGRVRRASKGILHTSGCPMPYLGPYHLPLFKGSPQMLSTGSNRFERWQGNSDIIAFASRGYRDNIDPKSEVFFRSLNLIPNPRGGGLTTGPSRRKAAQHPQLTGKHPQLAGKRREAPGSIRSAGQRRELRK